jgi:hypothetical protein
VAIDSEPPDRPVDDSDVSAPGHSIADPARRAEFAELWASGIPLEDVLARRQAQKDAKADAAN